MSENGGLFSFGVEINTHKKGSYCGGRAKESGSEQAGRGRAEEGRVAGAFPSRALMIERLVGRYHGSCQLKAAVVAVVLDQREGILLF